MEIRLPKSQTLGESLTNCEKYPVIVKLFKKNTDRCSNCLYRCLISCDMMTSFVKVYGIIVLSGDAVLVDDSHISSYDIFSCVNSGLSLGLNRNLVDVLEEK